MPTQIFKLSEITVAILAGGLGTRLAPIVPNQQKVVAYIRNQPFLKYILDQLHNAGFKNVVLCTGHLGNLVQKEFGVRYKSLSLRYSHEKSRLGTAGALQFASPLLKSQVVLVMNGDTFCDIIFDKFWRFHLKKKSSASLVLSRVSDTSRYGTVKIDPCDRIIKFQEKTPKKENGLVNAGIYLINKTLLSEIPIGKKVSLEKEIFPSWIGKGFYAFRVENEFIDIGTPESYKFAEEFFKKRN